MSEGVQDISGVIFDLSAIIGTVAEVSAKEKDLVESLPDSWRGEASSEYNKLMTELYNLDNMHTLLVNFRDELQRVSVRRRAKESLKPL